MEFAGSSYAVPIAICVVAGALVAFELWRRRGGAGGGAGGVGGGAGGRVGSAGDQVAADEIVGWHRQYEHVIFTWLKAADEVLAGAQVQTQTLAQFQSVSRHYLKVADKHPSETERAGLLEMYDCAQQVATALEAAAESEAQSESQARARYNTLRNRWVGHLRQLTTDDTFALQLLDTQ